MDIVFQKFTLKIAEMKNLQIRVMQRNVALKQSHFKNKYSYSKRQKVP